MTKRSQLLGRVRLHPLVQVHRQRRWRTRVSGCESASRERLAEIDSGRAVARRAISIVGIEEEEETLRRFVSASLRAELSRPYDLENSA
jgi:hypothetical protein